MTRFARHRSILVVGGLLAGLAVVGCGSSDTPKATPPAVGASVGTARPASPIAAAGIISSPAGATEAVSPPFSKTPDTPKPFDLRVIDYAEYPQSQETRAGWRRVGVFLELRYNGGLPPFQQPYVHYDEKDALFCGADGTYGSVVSVKLHSPSGADYPLEVNREHGAFACDQGNSYPMNLVRGASFRIYFHGWVPAAGASLDGLSLAVRVGRNFTRSDFSPKDLYQAESLPLVKAPDARPDDGKVTATSFGVAQPLNIGWVDRNGNHTVGAGALGPNEHADIAVTGVTLSPTSYSRTGAVKLTYRVVNHTGYDFNPSVTNGTLIDARGYLFSLDAVSDNCWMPPEQTLDCELGGRIYSLPGETTDYEADLSAVTVILEPSGIVFQGRGG